jgi:pimeloyl-ACP methyl ester carboxylesterase
MIYSDHFAQVNNIDLHYIQYENKHPKLLLLHGLTANAHAFHGLIKAGLHEHFSVISVDQRGRGLSSKPAFAYSIHDHALDVIGLLDHLEIEKIHICGHSFGGLMASYLAYHYPERFNQIVILDAAPKMNPNTPEMLAAALSRIDERYPSFDNYLSTVKKAPYLTFWDEAMLEYYKADVATAEDGSVEPRSNLADIGQIAYNVSQEPWDTYFQGLEQHSLLINALDDYTLSQPLLPDHLAKEAVESMKNGKYQAIDGNHQTMLFGEPGAELLNQLRAFIKR